MTTAGPEQPTRVRYGVLGFACALSMITYLDRVCFGTVAPYLQGEFGISDEQKGMLFTAFALAYAMFEVPSGWLGDVFGPRKTLIRIVLWWSFFTAMTGCIWNFTLDSGYRLSLPFLGSIPLLLNGFLLMLLVRFLFGMGEAGAYPNIARAFHNWFPFTERGSAQGAVWMAGRFAGGVTPWIVALLIFETTAADGRRISHWRHEFWIFGLLGLIWCTVFWRWFRDRPEQKAAVNKAELALIQAGGSKWEAGHADVPWRRLLTSVNLWALCLMYFCASYGWYFNITWLPGYLTEHYGVSKESESWGTLKFGLMAGAPLLVGSLACLLGGLLTDFIIRKTGNRKWGRRFCGLLGHSICAVCYLAASYARNPWLFVLAIALAAFWNDLTMGASWAICLDIGKRCSGIVAGCMNTIGNLGGALAGFITGMVLSRFTSAARAEGDLARIREATDRGWQANFFLFTAVYVVATLLWLRIDSTESVVSDEIPSNSN
jgi:MFS family permease